MAAGCFNCRRFLMNHCPVCSTRGRLIVSNKHVGVPTRITAALPKARGRGGNFGRRARLRIAKSSISKRSFSFQKPIDLRGESAIFRDHQSRSRPASKNVIILAQFLVHELI